VSGWISRDAIATRTSIFDLSSSLQEQEAAEAEGLLTEEMLERMQHARDYSLYVMVSRRARSCVIPAGVFLPHIYRLRPRGLSSLKRAYFFLLVYKSGVR
jgi:hypothetical protein